MDGALQRLRFLIHVTPLYWPMHLASPLKVTNDWWIQSQVWSGLQLQIVIDHTANPGVEIKARGPTQAL